MGPRLACTVLIAAACLTFVTPGDASHAVVSGAHPGVDDSSPANSSLRLPAVAPAWLADSLSTGSTSVLAALEADHVAPWLSESGAGGLLPLTQRKLAMFGIVALTLLLAASGGIGGGAVFVPLFIVMGEFTTTQAVALSNITVLGGALANLTVNLFRRHPILNRPLVDWDLLLVMEPTTILGALFGSYMNKLLPVWITSFLLAALLILLTVKLLRRAFGTFAAETAAKQHQEQLRAPFLVEGADDAEESGTPQAQALGHGRAGSRLSITSGEGSAEEPLLDAPPSGGSDTTARKGTSKAPPPLQVADITRQASSSAPIDIPASSPGADDVSIIITTIPDRYQQEGGLAATPHASSKVINNNSFGSSATFDGGDGRRLRKADHSASFIQRFHSMLSREQQQVPLRPIFTMLLLAGAVVATDMLKSKVPCGTWRYWLVVGSVVPLCLAVTLVVRHQLLRKASIRDQAGLDNGPQELKWTAVNTILYPAICSIAGLVAGLFGVGGGIVKSPLMLELGVCPQVAAATSSTMIAFTAGSACVVYAGFGGLQIDYAIPLWVMGFLVTLMGQCGTSYLVKLLKRKSIIIFMMGSLMGVSMVAALYQAEVNGSWALAHPDEAWQGGTICAKPSAGAW